MAAAIRMKHKQTGIMKKGYYGFSWTSLLFGGFPALFRGDILYGLGAILIGVILGMVSMGILALVAWLIWGSIYNKNYTHRLLLSGFEFDDEPERVDEAKEALGLTSPT